ncbi:MAG: sigma-70 family RNA polymerase sigma factor, partial [Planctomycetes bacterium]|nr:sigma-70 family RNA polymerase sigma factor [Planctomycetota bacterium]
MERTDHELLAAYAGRGDLVAFQRLVERHQLRLIRLADAIIVDAAAAVEAVDEGFLRLARHADTLGATARSEGLGGWLCTVVRNAAIDLLRRGRGPTVLPLDGQADAASSDQPCATAQAGTAETGTLLWREVAGLPPLERAAVVLRYRDGLA